MRNCRRHGHVEFHAYGTGQGRFRLRCRRCVGEAVTRRHRKVRAQLLRRAGGRCAVCGYDCCPFNLHFHHVDPAVKSFPMTMASGKSIAAYTAEADKCVLVCANCHGEKSPPAGATYADLHPDA